MTTNGKLMTVLMMGLFLVPAAGCGEGKPSCELLYKRLDKCDKMEIKKSAFIKMCNAMKDEAKDEIACSAKSDCGEFKKCIEVGKKAKSAARAQKKLDEAMAKNNIKEAMMTCDIYKEDLSDDAKKKCADLGPKLYDELMKKAQDLVKTAVKADFSLCYDLKDIGKKISPEKEKAAELICKEIDVQVETAAALKDIDKAIAEGKDTLSFRCMASTIKEYDDLGTEFAKAKKKELIQACFIKHGKIILEKHVPDMKGFCKFQVKDIYDFVTKNEIKDAAIDALITQAAPLCSK